MSAEVEIRLEASSGKVAERRCELCRELLEGRRSDARYCSGACRAAASRARSTPGEPPEWFWSGWWGVGAQTRTDRPRGR